MDLRHTVCIMYGVMIRWNLGLDGGGGCGVELGRVRQGNKCSRVLSTGMFGCLLVEDMEMACWHGICHRMRDAEAQGLVSCYLSQEPRSAPTRVKWMYSRLAICADEIWAIGAFLFHINGSFVLKTSAARLAVDFGELFRCRISDQPCFGWNY